MNELKATLGAGLQFSKLPVAVKGPWVMVGQDTRRQGWKLHLSCTPDRSRELLERIAPLLDARHTPFKFAKTLTVLENINAGQFGHTQVGKFVTVYPRADEIDEMARALIDLTHDVEGPVVSSDFFLGGSVYARHGAISPVLQRDRLGGLHKLIDGPDGLQEDVYAVPPTLNSDTAWPFQSIQRPTAVQRRQAGVVAQLAVLGWRPVALIKQKSKGAIVRAVPSGADVPVQQVAIKQARRGHLSDRWGRDAVTRLRQEFQTHQQLSDGHGILRATRFEEINGDGFLFSPFVVAQDLEAYAISLLKGRPLAFLAPHERQSLLKVGRQLIDAVAYLHSQDLIHRDLAPANVLVTEDMSVQIIDLEMVSPAHSSAPPVGVGTKGFVSPNQAKLGTPDFADDIYSVGALLQLLFIGIDPRRIQAIAPAHRLDSLRCLMGYARAFDELMSLACRATDDIPQDRPSLADLQRCIDALILSPEASTSTDQRSGAEPQETNARHLWQMGGKGLAMMAKEGENGWPKSIPLGGDESECEERDLEPLLSINRGLAGLVYVQAKTTPRGPQNANQAASPLSVQHALLLQAVQNLSACVDGEMPGLHFGTAGIAVALHEAALAGGCEAPTVTLRTLLDRPFDWHDLMHGAAGQGLGALLCGDRFHHLSARACAYLASVQSDDGSWPCPNTMPSLAGQTHTGFAHGAAGILYFLATHALITADTTHLPTIDRGLAWLLDHADLIGHECVDWRYSSQRAEPMQWWCHGGPGIALTLARIFELTGQTSFLQLAERSLHFHEQSTRHSNLGQCHGLSGLGEIYLEVGHVSGSAKWHQQALRLVEPIAALATHIDQDALVWRTENAALATADFGVGSAGVVHFLARVGEPDADIAPPLLMRLAPSQGACHDLTSTAKALHRCGAPS
jgi:serine/threonine protein kinase